MRKFRDISIRYKLTLLLMGVVSVVLLAVSITSVVVEVRATSARMAARYSTLAKIVADQSGAALSIADVDASGAQRVVSNLNAEPAIRFAVLYNAEGAEVATFQADATESQPSPPAALGAVFADRGYLDVVEQVRLNDGAIVGRLYLRATTQAMRRQVQRTVVITIVVYVIALALALLLSVVLQRFITTPILQLARLTERVSSEHNYSLTAVRRGNDELGALCDRFNSMLADIRRRDDELKQSNDKLQRSNEELSQFAYVASHDLQEPLRKVVAFCQALQQDYDDRLDDKARGYIQYAVDGARRMKALVNDLLSYSRVQSQGKPLEPTDANDACDQAIQNLGAAIEEAEAVVSRTTLPVINADQAQLVRLFQNLIGNAIKYRGQDVPRIRIDAEEQENEWLFRVSDNGIGIEPEYHDRIFVIFQRLHARDEYSGTGIGLAVCKRIVQRAGGRIWVESSAGAGSVFCFTLPKSLTPEKGAPSNDSKSRKRLAAVH